MRRVVARRSRSSRSCCRSRSRSTRTGKPTAGARQEARRARALARELDARGPIDCASPTARPSALFHAGVEAGRAARARAAGRARRRDRDAADPEGDELREPPAATTTTIEVRAPGAPAARAARRRRRAGDARSASPPVAPPTGHRFLSRARHRRSPRADAYAPTLEAEGKVIPSFAARRAAIERRAAKARAGRPRRSRPTRCSTR